jgi:hypothetical protein
MGMVQVRLGSRNVRARPVQHQDGGRVNCRTGSAHLGQIIIGTALRSYLISLSHHLRLLRWLSDDSRTCDGLGSMAFHDVLFLGSGVLVLLTPDSHAVKALLFSYHMHMDMTSY